MQNLTPKAILTRFFRLSLREIIGITIFVGLTLAAIVTEPAGFGDPWPTARLYSLTIAASVILSFGLALTTPAGTREVFVAYALGAIAYALTGPVEIFPTLWRYFRLDTNTAPIPGWLHLMNQAMQVPAGYLCAKFVYARTPNSANNT
jgi:hypothetical protein